MKCLDASIRIGNQTGYTFYSFHSWIADTVAVLLLAIAKVSSSTSEAVDKVAFTLDVVNLVAGLVEVEIGMLDGHVRSV